MVMAMAPRHGNAGTGWYLAALAAVCLWCTSAAAVVESRDLPTGTFDRVHFSGTGIVRLTQGQTTHLAVRAERQVLDALNVFTEGGALVIEAPADARGLEVSLQITALTAFVSDGDGHILGRDLHLDSLVIEGNGGGRFDLERLEADALEVRGRGTTRFDLTGQVASQLVVLSGTGAYSAGRLISDDVTVRVAGASDVRLWADQLLNVEVAGSARIHYSGSPQVDQQVSGVARVLHIPRVTI